MALYGILHITTIVECIMLYSNTVYRHNVLCLLALNASSCPGLLNLKEYLLVSDIARDKAYYHY